VYSGLLPRLIGELLTIWLVNVLTHLINTHMPSQVTLLTCIDQCTHLSPHKLHYEKYFILTFLVEGITAVLCKQKQIVALKCCLFWCRILQLTCCVALLQDMRRISPVVTPVSRCLSLLVLELLTIVYCDCVKSQMSARNTVSQMSFNTVSQILFKLVKVSCYCKLNVLHEQWHDVYSALHFAVTLSTVVIISGTQHYHRTK